MIAGVELYLSSLSETTNEEALDNPVAVPVVLLPEPVSRDDKIVGQRQQAVLIRSLADRAIFLQPVH